MAAWILLNALLPALALAALVLLARAGSPRRALDLMRDRIAAAGRRAAAAPRDAAETAWLAAARSWWVRLALAAALLLPARPPAAAWFGLAWTAAGFAAFAVFAGRLPFAGRRLAEWTVTAGGWMVVLAVFVAALDAGGFFGWAAAAAAVWAFWGALQNQTLARDAAEQDRAVSVCEVRAVPQQSPERGDHDAGDS